jgi:hypothetical protein
MSAARAKALQRRTKPSFAVRVRTFWVVAVLVLVACLAAAIAIVNAPQLRVRAIDAIVPADSPVTKAQVLGVAHVEPDANLWLLNTGAMRSRLEAIPYVLTAATHRAQFPKPAIAIEITLRRPTGCVKAGAATVTIDSAARVLQTGCVSGALPLVDAGTATAGAPGTTLDAPDINQLLTDAKAIGEHIPVKIVRRDRFGGLEALDSRGVVLKFGPDADLAAKVALVEPVRAAAKGRPLRSIDLRAPNTPVVEFQ